MDAGRQLGPVFLQGLLDGFDAFGVVLLLELIGFGVSRGSLLGERVFIQLLGWKRLNLSISLNAADDGVRDSLMPLNRKYPLRQVQQALIDYRQRNNLAIGVNYCLMPGLNDAREDAAKVARFCEPLGRALVNVIPYNPGSRPLTRAPEDAEVVR